MATKNLGRIVGLSAYEVWLEQGNTGTEEDFLNSLKGIDGKDGLNGIDGKAGEGLPTKGSYGDIIIKNSDKDYDTKWMPFMYNLESSPNFMPDSSLWVKGFINRDGTLYNSENYMSTPYLTVPTGILTIQYQNNNNWAKRAVRSFACYDVDKNYIAKTVISNPTTTEITIPEGIAYIRVSLPNIYVTNSALYKTMIVINNTGELLGKYVESGGVTKYGLNEKIKITDDNLEVGIRHNKSLNVDETSRKFEIHGDVNSSYVDIADFLSAPSKTTWLYGLYDSLVEAYPDYVTRTKIAETTTPSACYDKDGVEKTGLKTGIPMYRYDFKPPIASNTINKTANYGYTPEIPKILYTGGIHGGEYLQTMSAFRFFKALCDNWKNHDLLSCLRWNVHFVVIPTTNPFGYEYPSNRYDANGNSVAKRNERNIDISGNFPSNDYKENEGNEYKYGTKPLTEPESIALYNIIQNEDFILSIDNHTFNCLSGTANKDKMVGYFIANQWHDNSLDYWWKISRHLNERIRKLSPIDSSYDSYDMVQIWTDGRQQMLSNTFRSVGANIEMTLGIHPTDSNLLKEETQEFCVDELAVVFYEAYKDFWCYKK